MIKCIDLPGGHSLGYTIYGMSLHSIGFLGILTLASAVRIIGLDSEVISCDEAFSWRVAMCSLPELIERVADDTHPALHFVLLRGVVLCFGDDLYVLRSISVLAGIASVAVSYFLSLEAFRFRIGICVNSKNVQKCVSLLVALVIALHPMHIEFSRAARMYSLASLLTAVSCWLLLMCMQSPQRIGVWIGYGVTAGLLLHTHNYAFFALAGQAFYVTIFVVCSRCSRQCLPGIAVAGIITITAYAPWVPVLITQVLRVKASFWIPSISLMSLADSANSWLFGLHVETLQVALFTLIIIGCVFLKSLDKPDRSALFFLAQAGFPWILAIAVSLVASRPILQDRYLIIASIPFFVLAGMLFVHTNNAVLRLVVVVYFVVPFAYSTFLCSEKIPQARASYGMFVQFLNNNYANDDLIISSVADMNVLLYYAQEYEFSRAIRCPANTAPRREVHVNHISSISPEDLVDISSLPQHAKRIWVINRVLTPSEVEWQPINRVVFRRAYPDYILGYRVELYECVTCPHE